MQFSPFVHLHNHSDFSLLGGVMDVKSLLASAANMRQPAVALTDYGNLFGAVAFYSQAMRMGIKPILGCEFYVCDDHTQRISDGPRGPRYAQLVLLARNQHGWKNLLKLVSSSYLDGFYYKPRIDKTMLRQWGQGLIGLSSGWNGEIEQYLQRNDEEMARRVALEYKEILNQDGQKDCFFIELQRHGHSLQEDTNRALIQLAHDTDIPLVASNNTHFVRRDDFPALEAMLALASNRTIHDDVAGNFTPECYMRSYEEMQALFEDVPEALENTVHIANRCNVDLRFGQYQLPDFETPGGIELNAYMRQQAAEGLDYRWPAIIAGDPDAVRETYEQRLNFELDIIIQMGFPGYFLIVADFIKWAKNQEIPVGPGRGSGAGSLVAYVMLITDLDPIKYGLLFERFLNPERVSMPDFDIDFCQSRREEVIRYVTRKYGEERVSQIITFGSMKAKAVVRDVGRVLGMELGKVNTIAKLIPTDMKMTLEKARAQEERLEALIESDDEVARLFDLAVKLEGKHRNAGKHAAGVIIGREPLVENAPLFKVPGEDSKVVQWDMGNAEKMGLIKFDFLGLKTLTVIDIACRLIRQHDPREEAKTFDLSRIPMDDPASFALLQRGQTGAVFQVESSGMRDLLTRLRPDCFEDIIALVALYRPGPLESGMVDTYIECKHGRAIEYLLPQLEPILQETNGVILYQEQVMQIAQVLAGYSLGQADLLRRAMGKKKPEEMAEQRQIFMTGAEKLGVNLAKAEETFDLMEKFAGYGFNKSHSAAYALIAYQTAYLKAHFPQAFMAATMTCDAGNSDKIASLVRDCRDMGIDMLPPDINASHWVFVPEGTAIRFSMGAIKGAGEAVAEAIIAARSDGGMFTSFEDLVTRLPPRTLNKRFCEVMIKAGAMNSMIPHVRAGLEGLPAAIAEASRRRDAKLSRQLSLFEVAEPSADGSELFSSVKPWSRGQCLQLEREVLGFYLSGHPLEDYNFCHNLGNAKLGSLDAYEDDAKVVIPIGISSVREHRTARGCMAFVGIEDLYGSMEMVCFANVYEPARELLQSERPLLLAAKVDRSKEEPSLLAEAIMAIDEILPALVARIEIKTSTIALDEHCLQQLHAMRQEGSDVHWLFEVRLSDGSMARLDAPAAPSWSTTVQEALDKAFGAGHVRVQCRTWKPDVKQHEPMFRVKE
jgi:DNA polymerase-3 subunit alpha